MKKRILIIAMLVAMMVCLFVITAAAETVYVNSNGEQVDATDSDIAYEFEINNPYDKNGNCSIRYVYLHDTTVTKLIIPEIKLTHSNGTVYDFTTYSFVRLSTGYGTTLGVYTLADKDTKANSLHAQIEEIEFYIPILGDGASSAGNLANYTGLKKLSFFNRAYEPQGKGGFLSGCTSLTEIHFYGQNNLLTGNFFPSNLTKVVFHRNTTGVFKGQPFQSINSASDKHECIVYLSTGMAPNDETDPRLTWNKSNTNLKFVLLVDSTTGYTAEQIESYETIYMAGNNKNANNAKYSAKIQTYCDFYKSHVALNEVSACLTECTACKYSNENHEYSIKQAIAYADFTQNGLVTYKCENCDSKQAENTPSAPAIFTYTGFSLKTNDTGSICIGYTVNNIAKAEYEAFNSTLSFGVVGYIPKSSESPLEIKEGAVNVVTPKYTVHTDLTQTAFTAFDFKIVGFNGNTNISLVMCAYVFDGQSIYYLNVDKTTNTLVQSTSATTFSYDDLDALRVASGA